ncbi:hypothetical protein [Cohnella sp. AR92]|uniref:hypothetical protein n=1 Tax=Cohnella sp. AR92 TaxID=648716 RepID=UPI000F8F50C7|nr:hypothetical protein [Cohnella sp. AR92]RUS48112.1 hypothetical protein ELR57_06165 [Cohnella sp. AR92]
MKNLARYEESMTAMDWRSEFDLEWLRDSIESKTVAGSAAERMASNGYSQLKTLQAELSELVAELERFVRRNNAASASLAA